MEVHQLRYFLALAEELHFSRAAKRLHITQPALSRQIAVLEARLGVALFDRGPQGVRLTEAGVFFQPRALEIVSAIAQTAEDLQQHFSGALCHLHLGFLSVLTDDVMIPVVRECRRLHPRLRIHLHELSPRQQVEKLKAGEIDAAILGNVHDADRMQFLVRPLSHHPMAAVLPEEHPLSKQPHIHLSQLASERWVSLDDELFPGRREFLRRVCRAAGFEPEIVQEVESLSLMLGAVGAGDGVAILPRHSAKLSHRGCVFLSLQAPVPQAELLMLTRAGDTRQELGGVAALITERAREVMR